MGYYVNRLPNGEVLPSIGKADKMVSKIPTCTEVDIIKKFEDIPQGKGLVCCVENSFFDAVLVCVNQREIDETLNDDSGRKMRYFLLDKDYLEKEIDNKF